MSLLEAINNNDLIGVQQLIADGSHTKQIESEAHILLENAERVENLEIIKALLEAGVSPDWEGLGKDILSTAIIENHVVLVNTLINTGAIINTTYEDGLTPLMIAAARSSLEIVDILVRNAANVNAVSDYGDFALLSAAINDRQEIFNYLAPLTSSELKKQIPHKRKSKKHPI